MSDIDFPSLIEPVARHFWGEPPKGLITGIGMRFGSQGSKSIVFKTGEWYDHEQHQGGGVLALIMREVEDVTSEADAVRWLEDNGFIAKDPAAAPQARQERRDEPTPPEVPSEDDRPPAGSADEGKMVAVKGYHYTDGDGNLLYDVIRYQWQLPDGSFVIGKSGNPKKTFRQRRPDGRGGYIWNLEGIGHQLYHRPQLEIGIAEGRTCYLAEGEKDVETLDAWGLLATTNSGGAANWRPDFAETFRGADVVILGDDDDAGRKRTEDIALTLRGVAGRIRVIGSWGGPKDVTDWRDKAGGDASKLVAILSTVPDWRPAPPKSKFGGRRAMSIAGAKIVYDWLIKGLVERGGVFIVAGEKQAGKSFFMMDMAGKIALDRDYCQRKVKHGAVLYVALEDRKGVDMRFEGWRRENNIPPEQEVPFVILGGEGQKLNLLSDESVDAFIAECEQWAAYYAALMGIAIELIVIDTFSVATEGLDEIHSGEVGKVLARVNRIADRTKAAVCLVHHMNGEGSRVRGHSSLTANVSQVIEIRNLHKPQPNRRMPPEVIKDADGRTIRQAILEKNKNGPNSIKWRFVLRQVKLGFDDDGFEITTCVLDAPSSEPDDGQVKTGRLSQPQKLVYDALKAAIEDHGKPIPGNARAGSSVRMCVERKHFVAAVRKVMEFKTEESEQESRNKELSDFMGRNVLALINGGYMGRDNDLGVCWLTGKDDRVRPDPKPIERPAPTLSPADAQALIEAPF